MVGGGSIRRGFLYSCDEVGIGGFCHMGTLRTQYGFGVAVVKEGLIAGLVGRAERGLGRHLLLG